MVLTAEAIAAPQSLSSRTNSVSLTLRSRIAGRERWECRELVDNPGLARSVELLLGSETGVREVTANPVTGRILVQFDPAAISRPVERMLRSVLSFGPMTEAEGAKVPRRGSAPNIGRAVTKMLAGELVCSLLKAVMFTGAAMPARAATAAVMLLMFHRPRRA